MILSWHVMVNIMRRRFLRANTFSTSYDDHLCKTHSMYDLSLNTTGVGTSVKGNNWMI